MITGNLSTNQVQYATGHGPGIITGFNKTWQVQRLEGEAYPEVTATVETSQIQSVEAQGHLSAGSSDINGQVATNQVQYAIAHGPGIITGFSKTWQVQRLEGSAYPEVTATVIAGQLQSIEGTGTVTEPEEPPQPPQPRQERMGGSGTYYGPFGAPFLIPVNQDLGYTLGGKGLIDVAVRFGKGDTWKRANAVNRSETEPSYQVTVESLRETTDSTLAFLKSLPKPAPVDHSMSFLKGLGTPSPKIINEEPETVIAPKEEPITESTTLTKPTVSEAVFVGVSEFKEVLNESVVKTGRPAPSIKVTATLVPIV